MFVSTALGLPTILGVERSWVLPASSIKFLTRRSLKSRWVYLAPREGNRIQLLSTVRSRRWKNKFRGPLVTTSTDQITVCHVIRIVDVAHVLVIPCHDMRLHRALVFTKIPFCWWWVHVSQHVNVLSVLPN
jgi:hypothetical protein